MAAILSEESARHRADTRSVLGRNGKSCNEIDAVEQFSRLHATGQFTNDQPDKSVKENVLLPHFATGDIEARCTVHTRSMCACACVRAFVYTYAHIYAYIIITCSCVYIHTCIRTYQCAIEPSSHEHAHVSLSAR